MACLSSSVFLAAASISYPPPHKSTKVQPRRGFGGEGGKEQDTQGRPVGTAGDRADDHAVGALPLADPSYDACTRNGRAPSHCGRRGECCLRRGLFAFAFICFVIRTREVEIASDPRLLEPHTYHAP